MTPAIQLLLEQAFASRAPLLDPTHQSALRLFNGFYEGDPDLVVDVYGKTLLVYNHADEPSGNQSHLQNVIDFSRNTLNWLRAGITKTRNAETMEEKRGRLIFGDQPDIKLKEHAVWYTVDLLMNRDAGFYLDTRGLRKWLIDNMQGKTVLNTFAYTGSLGVAALGGGASRVIQTDRNRNFLNQAKDSYTLNGFPIHNKDFIAQDFFPAISRFKSTKQLFDCVIIDPPFFSTTVKGRVDLVHESARLINKIRPLIKDGGTLIAINNAVYVSGQEYINTLEELCRDGYLEIKELIPVPEDIIGFHRVGRAIKDPAPFNHSTKIAILKVRRQ